MFKRTNIINEAIEVIPVTTITQIQISETSPVVG